MPNEQIRLVILVALLSVSGFAARAAAHHRLTQNSSPTWSAVPYQNSRWRGKDIRFDPIYGADPADTSLLRIYRREDDLPVIVYVGFYRDLTTMLDVHSPELCYPAQGWTVLASKKLNTGTYAGKRVMAEEILVEKAGDRRIVTWWYNSGARPFQFRIRHVYAMLALSTITGRKDGSIVRLETPLESTSEFAAESRINDFSKSFSPGVYEVLSR